MSNVLLTAKNINDRTEVLEVRADPESSVLVFIDFEHSKVHSGLLFSLSGVISSLAAGSTTYFHGLTDSRVVHFREGNVSATGAPIDIAFYEGATVSANGTELTALNRNRKSSNTPTLQTFSGPTVTDVGTLLEAGVITVSGPGKQSGNASLFGTEWILKNATSYLIEITNNDNSAVDIYYNFFWYES